MSAYAKGALVRTKDGAKRTGRVLRQSPRTGSLTVDFDGTKVSVMPYEVEPAEDRLAARMGALDAWLARIGASLQYDMRSPAGNVITQVWMVRGKHRGLEGQVNIVLVQRFLDVDGRQTGFDVYVPGAPGSNEVAATLDGAAEALGVDGCRDLVPA